MAHCDDGVGQRHPFYPVVEKERPQRDFAKDASRHHHHHHGRLLLLAACATDAGG